MLAALPAALSSLFAPPGLLSYSRRLRVAATLLLIVAVWGDVTPTASAVPAGQTAQATAQQATPDTAFLPPAVPGLEEGPRLDRPPTPWYWHVVDILILALFLSLPVAFPVGFAAVALFMDSGCFRAIVAGLAWLSTVVLGLILGLMLVDMAGWPGETLQVAFWGSTLLFWVSYFWGKRRVARLSEADRLTWKRTLTGGAFIGTGIGSMLNVARSAGALFRGGGGSFGGGGASGSFGSAQAAAAPIASPGVATPGAVAKGTAALGQAGASAPAAAAGVGAGSARVVQHVRTQSRSWLRAAIGQLRRLRWYHGVGFLFTLLIFVPVGLGLTAILGQPRLLLGIIGIVVVLRLFWLMVVLMARFGILSEKSQSGNTEAGVRDALPMVLLVLLLVGLVAAPIFAADSQAPQWHLAIACAGLIAVEGALVFLPDTDTTMDAEHPFGGGSTSARW